MGFLRYVVGESLPRIPLGTVIVGVGVTAWVGIVTAASDATAATAVGGVGAERRVLHPTRRRY